VAVAASVGVTGADLLAWRADFEEMFARIAGRFGRVEPRRQARAFLLGLLSDVDSRHVLAVGGAGRGRDATPDAAATR
jgi:hypothetical protein